MKKFFKILIPILLALAVLGSIAWYMLVYDRSFTRDILLSQARYQESKGNHALAAWIYDQAYYQSSKDEDVAIELADQYKAIGNYTKAEYTLSKAIADGGTAKLYMALCKTYVEQDKLLDAVTMLNNVTDSQIKADLDAMRPATPVVSPEPGFYTQYISVSCEAASGLLFVSTDGQYPSIKDAPYDSPFTLPAGETMVYAVAVGADGLVSDLGIYGYTVGGVVEQVSFADADFEHFIRTTLNIADNKPLMSDELWTIKSLELPAEVKSYEDLRHLPYLETLSIHGSTGDLSPVGNLTALKTLDLSGSVISADLLEAIGKLPELTSLTLSDCSLSTLAGLEEAESLVYLDLQNNSIRNLSPIAAMPELQKLYLQHNALTDLSSLSGLTKLQELDVSHNSISSVTALDGCTALVRLNVSGNAITSADGINRLSALTALDLSSNQLTDVTPVAACTKLEALNISTNAIADISGLSALTALTTFDFSYNQVAELPQWPSDLPLITIDGSHNLLVSIDGLAKMPMLNNVHMDYNQLTPVGKLASCHRLIVVNVYGNEITDASVLTDQGIIVNYNPVA